MSVGVKDGGNLVEQHGILDGVVNVLTLKIGKYLGLLENLGELIRLVYMIGMTGLDSIVASWTAPLCRFRRDDRNAYIEHPIWSPDEKVMPPGRSAPRSASRRTGRNGSIRDRSCFDTEYAQVSTPIGYRSPHLIYMKGHCRLRASPRKLTHYPLAFISKP